jgi:hypothetical protein
VWYDDDDDDDDDDDKGQYTSAEHNYLFFSNNQLWYQIPCLGNVPNKKPAISPFNTQVCMDTIYRIFSNLIRTQFLASS